jgi:hypothetical protein
MRPICQFILKKMGEESSSIPWSLESADEPAFQVVNDHLVEVFHRMLRTAAALSGEPELRLTRQLLSGVLEDLERVL